ncbi:DUF4376 domain-containing protein, partial [Salmonella enterica]|nr:DUF4376 domain-containing protein [Salmonella enterica]
MKILAVKDGCYLASGQIDCLVQFEDSGDFIPFTASADDTTDYGRQLFNGLSAGNYGPVTPFAITPEMIQAAREIKHTEIKAWRDAQENGSVIFTLNGHRWDCGKASQTRL